METKQHKLIRYLNDSYAAEMGGAASLKDLAAITTDPEVKQAVLDHMEQTKRQADRLAARIKALGGDKSEQKAIVDTVIAKGSSLTNIGHDRADKQTQDLIKAYALEHFEIGTYTSLYTYATAIGDYETAALADEIRAEEEMAAMRLQRFIPQVARLALDNASEYAAPPVKKGWNKAVMPALWVGGAALAAWGVSKLLKEGGEDFRSNNNMDTNFGTARTSSTNNANLSPDVAEVVTVQTDTVLVADVPDTPGYTRSADNYDINAETRPVTGMTSGNSGFASGTSSTSGTSSSYSS